MENENLRQCSCCNNNVNETNGIYIDNTRIQENFICNDCIGQCDIFYCNDCNCYHDRDNTFEHGIYDTNGNYAYSVCNIDDYIYCNCCDNYYENNNNAIDLNDGELCYCEKCQQQYESDFYYCEECDSYYTYDYVGQVTYNNGEHVCCENCSEDIVRRCDNCENYFHIDDTQYNEDTGYTLCDVCLENSENNYKNQRLSYHCFNKWKKHFGKDENENNTDTFYGVELEVDTRENYNLSQVDNFCKQINSKINSICEKDGSLTSRGIEIITHPSTLKYYYENYDNFNDTFKMLLDNGYLSHDLTQCGLHIHVTRPDNDTIDKILVVMEHYKEEIMKFSRRVNSQLHYCRFLSDYSENCNIDKEYFKTLYYIKKDKSKNTDRYMALNLTNSKTIEFRIFRGTLNTTTFYSCLEFVKNIVELCKKENDLSKITWERLTKGRYITKYVKEKDIFTNKIIYDKSRLVELKEIRENKIKDKIINFISKDIVKKFNKIKNINNMDLKATISDVYNLSEMKEYELRGIKDMSRTINNIITKKNDYSLEKFIQKIENNISYYNNDITKDIRKYIENLTNKGVY